MEKINKELNRRLNEITLAKAESKSSQYHMLRKQLGHKHNHGPKINRQATHQMDDIEEQSDEEKEDNARSTFNQNPLLDEPSSPSSL